MAKTLTLEEAAEQLGLTPEQFKLNLKTHKDFKSVRPLMGGASMHFREQDIAELGRKIGLGSEPELQLGDAGSDPVVPLAVPEDQVEIGQPTTRGSGSRLQGGSSKRLSRPKQEDQPLDIDTSDEFVPLVNDPKSGKSGKKGDSDARAPRDSGARLQSAGAHAGGTGTPTEEIDLDAESKQPKKGDVFQVARDSGSKTGKSSGKNKPVKKADPGSDFELELGTDSDSEFELTLADSDEVDLGAAPRDATGKSGKSGVKLNKPADSGISLEKATDDDESDFELNLDSASAHKVTGPRSSKKSKKDSESEFELSLDDSSGEVAALGAAEEQKDIFATDFDIPALDESGSEAVVLEDSATALESSDFDLDDSSAVEADESASEVVQLDEDLVEAEGDEARSSRRGKKRRGDSDVSADEALADIDEDEEEDEEPAVVAGPPAPARWGPLPALVLAPCLVVMMLIMFMGFELLHGMWSYRSGGTKPTYTITRGIAGAFGADLPKD